jgi:2'-5' RNA ligase
MVDSGSLRTIVVLLTPEADSAVGEIRRRFTPGGERGMPPHVTLLGPFVEVRAVTARLVDRLSRALSEFPAFDFELASVERFDAGVLYLAVDPIDYMRALIRRVCAEFPDFQPYGVYTPDTVIPHHTLVTGQGFPNGPTVTDLEIFDSVEAEVADRLPIRCRAQHVALMADGPDGWSVAWQTKLS